MVRAECHSNDVILNIVGAHTVFFLSCATGGYDTNSRHCHDGQNTSDADKKELIEIARRHLPRCTSRSHDLYDTLNEKNLTNAFIGSCLDYCQALLYGLPQSSISKLQRVQNAGAMLTGTKKCVHITPVQESLHWFPVEKRINFKVLLVMSCLA